VAKNPIEKGYVGPRASRMQPMYLALRAPTFASTVDVMSVRRSCEALNALCANGFVMR